MTWPRTHLYQHRREGMKLNGVVRNENWRATIDPSMADWYVDFYWYRYIRFRAG